VSVEEQAAEVLAKWMPFLGYRVLVDADAEPPTTRLVDGTRPDDFAALAAVLAPLFAEHARQAKAEALSPLDDTEAKTLRGLGQGQVRAAVERILRDRADAYAEGAAAPLATD